MRFVNATKSIVGAALESVNGPSEKSEKKTATDAQEQAPPSTDSLNLALKLGLTSLRGHPIRDAGFGPAHSAGAVPADEADVAAIRQDFHRDIWRRF